MAHPYSLLGQTHYRTYNFVGPRGPPHAVPMNFASDDLIRVVKVTFNKSDTVRYYRTHSAADGCAGLVAIDFVRFTRGIEVMYLRARRGNN